MKELVPNPLAGARQAGAFVQSYWQQQAGVILGALPASAMTGLGLRQVLRLASDDLAESRLVQRCGEQWQVDDGPFEPGEIPTMTTKNWTTLIQGVDLQLDSARALLNRFRFIPDARLDDLMISIAGDGGGVGPHVDDYDVFLLQLSGQRQWEIAPPGPVKLRDDQPLKLLRQFRPTRTVVLRKGDMLYLPAGWSHNGTAIGQCMTASIGFRAPTRGQLQSAWLQDMADQVGLDLTGDDAPYRDDLPKAGTGQWQRSPARIPTAMMDHLVGWLRQWQASDKQMRNFVGRYLTEPKANTWFDRPRKAADLAVARQCGISLDRKTRMLWIASSCFINGELVDASRDTMLLLRRLADQRSLQPAESRQLLANARGKSILTQWYEAGWVHPYKT
ncbi:MAG: cupin domain-containing protein [Burkholderiaceae bacterium]